MGKANVNSEIIKEYGIKAIAYNPCLGQIAGKADEGLFLCQLLYWWGKGSNKEYIYKTIKQIQKETHLTRSEQDRAIRVWKKLGVLEVKRKGIPPKRHFKINIDRVNELIEKLLKLQDVL